VRSGNGEWSEGLRGRNGLGFARNHLAPEVEGQTMIGKMLMDENGNTVQLWLRSDAVRSVPSVAHLTPHTHAERGSLRMLSNILICSLIAMMAPSKSPHVVAQPDNVVLDLLVIAAFWAVAQFVRNFLRAVSLEIKLSL
jgi:hypothetical protein